jgi:hypothetical protein
LSRMRPKSFELTRPSAVHQDVQAPGFFSGKAADPISFYGPDRLYPPAHGTMFIWFQTFLHSCAH